jgi:hypothetical protein
LVHVDDVDEGPQLVDRLEDPAVLLASLETPGEHPECADPNRGAEGRLDHTDELREAHAASDAAPVDADTEPIEQGTQRQSQERDRCDPEGPERSPERFDAGSGELDDGRDLLRYLSESAAGEALVDPAMEDVGRRVDLPPSSWKYTSTGGCSDKLSPDGIGHGTE